MASRQDKILENPATKFYKWTTIKNEENGAIEGGGLQYYDKELEKKVDVEINDENPFTFVWLNDDCVSYKGYNNATGEGVYSNEVSKPEHYVTVKSKSGVLLEFQNKDYKANKDKLQGLGAKYTKSVYIAVKDNNTGEWSIQNLQIATSFLTGGAEEGVFDDDDKNVGWMNFSKSKSNKSKFTTNFLQITGYKLRKNKAIRFTAPRFAVGEPISDADSKILDQLDTEIKNYFKEYFAKKAAAIVNEEVPVEANADDELPF
jgi:hypothetical protein